MSTTILTIGIIGAGKMGSMLLLTFKQVITPNFTLNLLASTSSKETSDRLNSDPRFEGITFTTNEDIFKKADIMFLCVKPHQLPYICQDNVPAYQNTLVSICAGVSILQLKNLYPHASIIRCMPSITCTAKKSTGLYIMSSDKTKKVKNSEIIEMLLDRSGTIFWVKAEEFDAATAIGASAPAFASIFLEGLADGAVSCGLPRSLAYSMGAQMLAGTAQIILDGQHPSHVKDMVSTPGGCTIEGLIELESNGFRGSSAKAIKATVAKMSQLVLSSDK